MSKTNPHIGSDFEDFLREDGRLEAATAAALKRVFANRLLQVMKEEHVTKAELSRRMGTSRTQVDRLLDADNPAASLESIARAAAALGRRVTLSVNRAA